MDKTFKPNVEWMAKKYDEMNSQLFNGELGACDFGIFTSGRGSQGGVLGWFKICGWNIKVDRHTRRMYQDGWDKTFVNKGNFVDICKPRIELNGNYSGSEHGFLATLVHEMCHYYTYMNGYCPKQGHGAEFKSIGYIVSARSKGMFTIQRLASAEQMSELELSDEMKAKKEKRIANKKASVTAIIVFTKTGDVQLTLTSSQNLINMITKTNEDERGNEVITSNDADVIEFLFSKGYRKNMRTWRYWSIWDKPWLDELKGLLGENNAEPPKNEEPMEQNKAPRYIFSIKTSNGTFEHEITSYGELKKALRERFPKMSEETLNKILANKSNYRMEEERISTKEIIKEVIEEFIINDNDRLEDSIEITQDMNLGEFSPLEIQ